MTKYEANKLKGLINQNLHVLKNLPQTDVSKGYKIACKEICEYIDEVVKETTDIEQPCTYAISRAALLKAIDDKSFYCSFMKDSNGDSESLWGCDFVEVDEIVNLINSMPNVLEIS